MKLSTDSIQKYIIEPYIQILNGLSQDKKDLMYEFLINISTNAEKSIFQTDNEDLIYKVELEELESLKKFLTVDFLEPNKEQLSNIISNIYNLLRIVQE